MIRTSLTAVVLFTLLALAPARDVQAQAADSALDRANATDVRDLSSRQAGISRATLLQHTRQVETAPAGATTALVQTRTRRGQTLMIVGGAAFLAGLIIGDDAGTAIAVGGAAIGLYGLYLWAQ